MPDPFAKQGAPMRHVRGVVQVPEVDGATSIVCRTTEGVVVRKVTLSASLSEVWIEWEIRKAEQWLDRLDPRLQLVAGDRKPSP